MYLIFSQTPVPHSLMLLRLGEPQKTKELQLATHALPGVMIKCGLSPHQEVQDMTLAKSVRASTGKFCASNMPNNFRELQVCYHQ